jgi:hypothetical protein
MTLTVDDLTLLSGNLVGVPLHASEHQFVHVFSASVHVPYVTAKLRTPTKVEQDVTALSIVHYDDAYTVPSIVDIDGLSLTPSKIGLAMETECQHELLHFGHVAEWGFFRGVVISRHLYLHEDTSLPMQTFFHPRFIAADCGHVWMLIKGYLIESCAETPTDLRTVVPAPTTNVIGMTVTMT